MVSIFGAFIRGDISESDGFFSLEIRPNLNALLFLFPALNFPWKMSSTLTLQKARIARLNRLGAKQRGGRGLLSSEPKMYAVVLRKNDV